MKCPHKDCSGNLVEQPEEKGRTGVFVCDKCGCTLCLTTVKYDSKCPMVSEKKEALRDFSIVMPEKKRRGRPPKNVSNNDVS